MSESIAIKEIGKHTSNPPVILKVGIQKGDECQFFKFHRSWKVLRTVIQLSTGQMAFVKMTYFVADDKIACQDLLIGRAVLLHLQVDYRTLLENKRALLDRTDCSCLEPHRIGL